MLRWLAKIGYYVIIWNLENSDYTGLAADQMPTYIHDCIPSRASDSPKSYIFLQHDIHGTTIAAQQKIINVIKKTKLQIVSPKECLPGINPYFKKK